MDFRAAVTGLTSDLRIFYSKAKSQGAASLPLQTAIYLSFSSFGCLTSQVHNVLYDQLRLI